jgi:hypothetical protein
MSGWLCEMGSGLVTGCFGTPSPQVPNSPSAQACRGVGELADFDYSTPQVRRRAGSWGVGDLGICRVAKLRKNGDWRKCQDGFAKWGVGLLRAVLVLQVPNSPSAQACRGVGELGSWPILSIQLPKCAGAPGSWGVGELGSWLGCQRAVWSRASFAVGSFWNGTLRGGAMAALCGKWMAVE